MIGQNVGHHYAQANTIRQEFLYKQLSIQTNRTSFYVEILTFGHQNTELRA